MFEDIYSINVDHPTIHHRETSYCMSRSHTKKRHRNGDVTDIQKDKADDNVQYRTVMMDTPASADTHESECTSEHVERVIVNL